MIKERFTDDNIKRIDLVTELIDKTKFGFDDLKINKSKIEKRLEDLILSMLLGIRILMVISICDIISLQMEVLLIVPNIVKFVLVPVKSHIDKIVNVKIIDITTYYLRNIV